MKIILPIALSAILSLFSFSSFAQNNAFNFDNVNDYVSVPNASSLISATTPMAMSCWVYPTNPAAGWPDFDGFLGFRNDNNADFYLLQLNSTTVEARFRNSAGGVYTASQPGLVLNTWQHFVLNYDGSTLKVYLNGVLGVSIPAIGNIASTITEFTIGKLEYGITDFYLNGNIDEVGLWSRSLSDAEVACIYQRGINPTDPNLELYFDFNEGVAGGSNTGMTTVTDRAGNINAQILNAALTGTSSNYIAGVASHTQLLAQICSGSSFSFGSQTLTTPGVYYDIIPTASCDSIVALTLLVEDTVFGTDTRTECSPFTWIDGNVYNANNSSAQYTTVGGAASGCDTTTTLNLTIASPNGTDVQTACGSFIWINGQTYTANNTTAKDTIVGGSVGGCDSIVTLNLSILSPSSGVDVQTACESFVWTNGITYTANNNTALDTIVGGAANACDSIVTLNLTILNPGTGVDVQTACESYTWINGTTYTASNDTATFRIVGGSANTCDSIVTLDLTILNPGMGTDVVAACDLYTWINGNTYANNNSSATFTIAGGSANGCDSVVTLNLTITEVDNNVSQNGGTLSSGASGASFQWLDCNDNFSPISGETSPSYVAQSNGSYALEITQNSCIDTSVCFSVSNVGILNNSFTTRVMVYPNPTKGNLMIDMGQTYSALSLEVFSINGQLISKQTFDNVQIVPVALEDAHEGVYFIHLFDQEKGNLQISVLKE